MIYRVSHTTRLAYAAPIARAAFNLRLAPIDWPGQRLLRLDLAVSPLPRTRREIAGAYPTRVTAIAFTRPITALEVISRFDIEVNHGPLPSGGPGIDAVCQQVMASTDMSNRSPLPYFFPSRMAPGSAEIADWAAARVSEAAGVIDAAAAICAAIHREFTYQPGTTTSTTPPWRAFATRKGVCQDFAQVMIVALRALGIPAAYVSGYLRTLPPPGAEKLVGADAMHAWVAVWCGMDLGWVGFDPTNDCMAHNDHVVVAMGRDYSDVSPIDGVFVGIAPQTMNVMVDVAEI